MLTVFKFFSIKHFIKITLLFEDVATSAVRFWTVVNRFGFSSVLD